MNDSTTPILHAPLVLLLLAAFAVACTGPEGGPDDDPDSARSAAPADAGARADVLEAARSVLRAINDGDARLLRRVVRPDAPIVATTPDGPPSTSTVDDLAARITGTDSDLHERMWNARIEVDGPLASVWAPYDFYVDGELSHCGIDAFQLVREQDRWRVQSLAFSRMQPPACETHPDGPPEG